VRGVVPGSTRGTPGDDAGFNSGAVAVSSFAVTARDSLPRPGVKINVIGRTILHYRIVEKIGAGGMGVVYKAEDTRLGRFVAIKFLPAALMADADARRRFINEARSAAALNHPHIAVVHDFQETPDGQTCMIMAYYDGATLEDRLQQGALPTADAVRIIRQVASALERAHASGIVHRDVKPANILLTSGGDALLADFGLARLIGSTRITRAGSTVGTVQYMSPEQARGAEVDARSDIFSLGVVFQQALTGELPFRGDHPAAVMYSIMNSDAEPLPASCPPALANIVNRMLARDPADRYPDARDLISDLDTAASGAAVAARSRRRPPSMAMLVTITAIICAGVGFKWFVLDHLHGHERAPLAADNAIAVLPLRNLSGDAGLDWMTDAIPEMLNAALSRSGDLRVLDRLRLASMLQGGAGQRVDAIAVARQNGIATLITGEIFRSGNTIRVQENVVDASSGRLVHSETAQGNRDDDLFKMVATLTDALQTFMHIQAASATVDEKWIRSVTSTSLDAFRHYVRGRNLLLTSQWSAARGEFEAAIAADSTFVQAYVDLTGACFNLEDDACIGAAYEHARHLRASASPREQLNIDLIGAIIHDQYEDQIRIATELVQMDPDGQFWRYALGRGYYFSGQYDAAVKAWQPLYAQRWKWVWTNLYMSDALCHLKRFDEALAVLRTGFSIVPADRKDLRSRLYRYKGRVLRGQGNFDAAAADFDSAEMFDPKYPLVNYDRGILEVQRGNNDRAAALLKDFLAANTTDPEVADARARLAALSH
jgi:TolB-like protein